MAVHLGQGVYYALPALSPTPTQEEPQKVVRHPCLGLGWASTEEEDREEGKGEEGDGEDAELRHLNL